MRFSPFDFDVITTPEMPVSRPTPRDTVPDRSSQTGAPDTQRQDATGEPADQGSRAK